MNEEKESTTEIGGSGFRKGLISFLASLARDAVQLLVAFVIGTGGGALVCWYYGLPLALSLLGGVLVLGLAVALTTDSWFS